MSFRNIDRYVRTLRDQLTQLKVPQLVEEQFGEFTKDDVFERNDGHCRLLPTLTSELDWRCKLDAAFGFKEQQGMGHNPGSQYGSPSSLSDAFNPLSRVIIVRPIPDLIAAIRVPAINAS